MARTDLEYETMGIINSLRTYFGFGIFGIRSYWAVTNGSR